jgi:hypothetical protein
MTVLTHGAKACAVDVAQAVLHQAGATGADEARQVMVALDRLAARLRAACGAAPESASAGQWPAPAAALLVRLEEATAWWTKKSRFPFANWGWDESATTELGMLLCELDGLAAALLTTVSDGAEYVDAAAAAEYVEAAAAVEYVEYVDADAADCLSVAEPEERPLTPPHYLPPHYLLPQCLLPQRLLRPWRRPPVRLLPSLSLAVAVIGVIGGVTATATHPAPAAMPRRTIAGEPVPFTLRDGEQAQAAAPAALPDSSITNNSSTPAAANADGSGSTGGRPATAQQQQAGTGAGAEASGRRPSPRHAAPKSRRHSSPPRAGSAAQTPLDSLVADISASAQQEAARRLSPLSWPAQNGWPAVLTPWG